MVFGFGNKYYKKNVPKKYKKLFPKNKMVKSVGQLAKRINYVRSLINVEYKTFDSARNIASSFSNVSSTFTLGSILTIPQGVTEQTRVGNSIKLKSIYVNYMFNANASATAPQNVRFLLIKDTNRDVAQNGTTLSVVTLGNVLNPDNLLTGQVDNLMAPLNDATSGRYSIVMNKAITLDRQSRSGYLLKRYIKLNEDIKYPANGENLPINSYYVVFITDQTANLPTFTGGIRVRFIDN